MITSVSAAAIQRDERVMDSERECVCDNRETRPWLSTISALTSRAGCRSGSLALFCAGLFG